MSIGIRYLSGTLLGAVLAFDATGGCFAADTGGRRKVIILSAGCRRAEVRTDGGRSAEGAAAALSPSRP
jgi:hypothetical protein